MDARQIAALNSKPTGIWPVSTPMAAFVGMFPVYGLAVVWVVWSVITF